MLRDFYDFTPERCLAGFSAVYNVFANTNTCQLAGLLKPVLGPTRRDFAFEQLHTASPQVVSGMLVIFASLIFFLHMEPNHTRKTARLTLNLHDDAPAKRRPGWE